jgi:hypothetical protein
MPELEGQPFLELLDTVYRTGVPHVGTEVKALLDSAATDQDQEMKPACRGRLIGTCGA